MNRNASRNPGAILHARPAPVAGPAVAYYFYRLKDDDFVSEFCVANAADPDQTCETLAPDGSTQLWDKRLEGDLVVFRPPDGYAGSQGLAWRFDGRLQRHEAAPRRLLERLALGCRVSVTTPAFPASP